VFKFVTRGHGADFDAAVFYNGQKLIHIYMSKHLNEVEVQVEDGSGHLMSEWEDFLEESD
jgi:hypothetical protein